MAVLDRNKPYPNSAEYWKMVLETLTSVFNVDGQDAAKLVNGLRARVADADPTDQLLFHHAEPLDIAADLISTRPTPTEVNRYLSLASKQKWIP